MLRFRSPIYRPPPPVAAPDETQRGVPPAPQPPLSAQSWLGEAVSLGRYLAQSEVHTYAFSVAANAILSLFPFIVMMLTIARRVLHSNAMVGAIGEMLHYFLPANQDFVVRNMSLLVHARGGVQVASIVTLLISSSGVFLPLEVALNQVWGVAHGRSYVMNQLISLGLAMVVGTLAMVSVAFTAAQTRVLTLLFFGHTGNFVFTFLTHSFLQVSAIVLSITIFFIIYWILPNRRLPVNAVLPTAIVIGLLWELAKIVYVRALVWMDLGAVYGPFAVSVGLMMWAFLTGLLLLAGAHYSANRQTLRLAREADLAAAVQS
jgi:YihY family inner membrane protein